MSETVAINRLYHRELLARMDEIEELERKWNCKIDFPSTEQASDMVTISGPEYQVPRAIDSVLVSTDLMFYFLGDPAVVNNIRSSAGHGTGKPRNLFPKHRVAPPVLHVS